MQFKPAKQSDDQEKIRSDTAHDVRVGGQAKVSLGGMSTANVKVLFVGKAGITVADKKGRRYKFIWKHVLGPTGAEPDDMREVASVDNDRLPKTRPPGAKEESSTHTPGSQGTDTLTKALHPTQTPHRALHPGDSVYFTDQHDQAQHGLVAAVGKHGVMIDAQDDTGKTTGHKVLHDKVIGHRKRAERKFVLIDKGEDGSLCVDEQGRRVFIRGDISDHTREQPGELTKALSGTLETSDDMRIMSLVRTALEPVQAVMRTMQLQHLQTIDRLTELVSEAIGKPLPEIRLQMPEQPPANIAVDVHVPEQPAPVVHVAAPHINVESPAPIVNVTIPPKKTITEIERDRDGNITRATQEDVAQ